MQHRLDNLINLEKNEEKSAYVTFNRKKQQQNLAVNSVPLNATGHQNAFIICAVKDRH